MFTNLKPAFAVALAAWAAAHAGATARAETGATMIAIDQMTVGSAPEGFSFARTGRGGPAQWSVTAYPTAAAGHAIEQVSTDRTDYRFPLAVYDATLAANLEVVVRFKAVAGKIDQAGGVALRLRDADNYYVARANALEDNVRFYRVVKGRREQLEGASLKVSANEWHNLGLRAEGDRFTVSYDGKVLFTATDATFAEAGKVALWTKSDSVTRFEQISITTLP
jgi:hypothetical protein